MNYTFKFSCGDTVYMVRREQKRVHKACAECSGVGFAVVNGKSWTCPECHGRRGSMEFQPEAYHADPAPYTVGSLRLEYTDSPGLSGEQTFSNFKPQKKIEEVYMLVETGIGSGSLWPVKSLFSTFQEAEDAAIRLQASEESADPFAALVGGPA